MSTEFDDIVLLSSDDDHDVGSNKNHCAASAKDLSQPKSTPKKKNRGKMPLIVLPSDRFANSGSTTTVRSTPLFVNTSQKKKYGIDDSVMLKDSKASFTKCVLATNGSHCTKNSSSGSYRLLEGSSSASATSNRHGKSPGFVNSSSPIFAKTECHKQSTIKVDHSEKSAANASIAGPSGSLPVTESQLGSTISKMNINVSEKQQSDLCLSLLSKSECQEMTDTFIKKSPALCAWTDNVDELNVACSSNTSQSSVKRSKNQNRLSLRKKKCALQSSLIYSDVEPSSDDEPISSRRKLCFSRKNPVTTDNANLSPILQNETHKLLSDKFELNNGTSNEEGCIESNYTKQTGSGFLGTVDSKPQEVTDVHHGNVDTDDDKFGSCSVQRLCESPILDRKLSTDAESLLLNCCVSLEKLRAVDLPETLFLSQDDVMTMFGQCADDLVCTTDSDSTMDGCSTRNASTSTSCTSQVLITPISSSYLDFISDDDLFDKDYFLSKSSAISETVSKLGTSSERATAVSCLTTNFKVGVMGPSSVHATAVSCAPTSVEVSVIEPSLVCTTVACCSMSSEAVSVVASPAACSSAVSCIIEMESVNALGPPSICETVVSHTLMARYSPVTSLTDDVDLGARTDAAPPSEQVCAAEISCSSICDDRVAYQSASSCSKAEFLCTAIKTEPLLKCEKTENTVAYSQADEDCFITSDSDDELFANLTQKVNEDESSLCSDDDEVLDERSSDELDDDLDVLLTRDIYDSCVGQSKTCNSPKGSNVVILPDSCTGAVTSSSVNSNTSVCDKVDDYDLWENDDEYMKDLDELYQQIVDPMEAKLVEHDEASVLVTPGPQAVEGKSVQHAVFDIQPETIRDQDCCTHLPTSDNNQAGTNLIVGPSSDSEDSDEFLLQAVELIDPLATDSIVYDKTDNSDSSTVQSTPVPQKTLRLQISRISENVFRELLQKTRTISDQNQCSTPAIAASESSTENESDQDDDSHASKNIDGTKNQRAAKDQKTYVAGKKVHNSSEDEKSFTSKCLGFRNKKRNVVNAEQVEKLVAGLRTKGRELASSILLPEKNAGQKRTSVTREDDPEEQGIEWQQLHRMPQNKALKTGLFDDVSYVRKKPQSYEPYSTNISDNIGKKISQLLTSDPRKLRKDRSARVPTKHRNPLISDDPFQMSQVSRAKQQLVNRTRLLSDAGMLTML